MYVFLLFLLLLELNLGHRPVIKRHRTNNIVPLHLAPPFPYLDVQLFFQNLACCLLPILTSFISYILEMYLFHNLLLPYCICLYQVCSTFLLYLCLTVCISFQSSLYPTWRITRTIIQVLL